MAATIVESLLVTLGLDPKQFQKGVSEAISAEKKLDTSTKAIGGSQEREAQTRDRTEDRRRAKADLERKKKLAAEKKAQGEQLQNLKAFGLQAAGLILGFEGLKGALNFFAGLTVDAANLGRLSKNLGENVHEVNAWDNAIELAGGSAKDAEGDLRQLSGSITALKTTGEVSPLLFTFQKLGVAIYDAQGKVRKLTDIYSDFGDRLRQYNDADAYNLATQAGLSESTYNFIHLQADERARILGIAEQNAALDKDSAEAAAKLQEEWRGVGQEIKNAGNRLLAFASPVVIGAIKTLAEVINTFTGKNTMTKEEAQESTINTDPYAAMGDADYEASKPKPAPAVKAPPAAAAPASGQPSYISTIADAEKAYGLPPGLLSKLIKTESNYNPSAYNAKSGATGIAQLIPKYHPDAGKDPHADIQEAAKTLRQFFAIFGDWTKAVAAYNDGPGNISKVLGGTKTLPDETQKYIQKVIGPQASLSAAQYAQNVGAPGTGGGAAPAGGGSSTSVDIDNVNIYTQATDANGIAAELPGALKRKGVVAQADAGMS